MASDCLNVVKAAAPFLGKEGLGTTMATSPFAGIAKSCLQQPGWAHIIDIWKVKAHTTAQAGESEEETRGRVGNHEADLGAKQGVRRHPQPQAGFWEGLKASEDALALLWRVAGATLPLYPIEKLSWTVAKRQRLSWENRKGHCWEHRPNRWLCIRCLSWTSSKTSAQQHKQCKGHSSLEAILSSNLGHRLVLVITTEGPVVACQACWAFVATFPKHLLAPCPGAPRRGGQVAKARVASGRHPNQKSAGRVLSICHLSRDKLGAGLTALSLEPSHRAG